MSVETYSGEINPWQPEHLLRTYSLQEIRYSAGFLLGHYEKQFKALLSYWLPVFDLAQIAISKVECLPGFQFPGELDFLYVVKKGEEFGLVGVDGEAFRNIASVILKSNLFSDLSGEFVVEYLARKLLFSIVKCWNGHKESDVTFFGLSDVGEIDIEGHLELRLALGDKEISIHFGLGPEQLQELDRFLKEDGSVIKSSKQQKGIVRIGIPIESKATNAIELGQALLLDHTVSSPLSIMLPDGRVVSGMLGQFNQRFAIESLGTLENANDNQSAFIEIAQANVDSIESVLNPGFIFLSKTVVSKNATLVADNNQVTDLSLYVVGDRLVAKKS